MNYIRHSVNFAHTISFCTNVKVGLACECVTENLYTLPYMILSTLLNIFWQEVFSASILSPQSNMFGLPKYCLLFIKTINGYRFCTSLSDRKSTHLSTHIFIRKCIGCSYKMPVRNSKVVLVIIWFLYTFTIMSENIQNLQINTFVLFKVVRPHDTPVRAING